MWFQTDVGAIQFSGIDLDVRAQECGPTLVPRAERTLLIEDATVVGRANGDANALMPRLDAPDGLGVIRRFVAREGGVIDNRRIVIWVGPSN